MFDETTAANDPAPNKGAEKLPSEPWQDGSATVRPVPEPQAMTKIDSSATNTKPASGFGLSGGQMFMIFITLIGVVLVAQGLRRKNMKGLPNDLAEIDNIRRELAAKYPIEPSKPRPQAAAPARELAADMRELTDHLSGQLDAKAARIEALLVQADARILELKYLAAQSADGPVAKIGSSSPTRSLKPENALDPTQQKVYDLADAGMSPVDIARAIQQPTGHVELILNLRATSRSAAR